ncbi:hypothetical protein GEMRC1_003077 [Eukaryota sp. GEM-RC1]
MLSAKSSTLPQLYHVASIFEATIKSIFFGLDSSNLDDLSQCSDVITGLALSWDYVHNFDFLKPSSPFYFSRLRILDFGYDDDVTLSKLLAVLEALKVNPTITSINLSGAFIGDEGAVALATMLKVNSTISSVDLSSNSIGDEGAVALATMLKNNSTISSVDLSSNSIGDEGVISLSETLKVNSTISTIYLSAESVNSDTRHRMIETPTGRITLCVGWRQLPVADTE